MENIKITHLSAEEEERSITKSYSFLTSWDLLCTPEMKVKISIPNCHTYPHLTKLI